MVYLTIRSQFVNYHCLWMLNENEWNEFHLRLFFSIQYWWSDGLSYKWQLSNGDALHPYPITFIYCACVYYIIGIQLHLLSWCMPLTNQVGIHSCFLLVGRTEACFNIVVKPWHYVNSLIGTMIVLRWCLVVITMSSNSLKKIVWL